jgi:hypothetical protein
MPGKDGRTKPKYEPPTLVPLGELATGVGDCAVGSAPGTGTVCSSGTFASGGCNVGATAAGSCNAGTVVV